MTSVCEKRKIIHKKLLAIQQL